jgi:hypothetical protein
MPKEYTFLLNNSYSRESRTDFSKAGMKKSVTGPPGNETQVVAGGKRAAVMPAICDTKIGLPPIANRCALPYLPFRSN